MPARRAAGANAAKARPAPANRFSGEGAKGACYVTISEGGREGTAWLDVGHSCAVVHDGEIPVTWLAELVAIATLHEDGIAGFLRAHGIDGHGRSYALECDPPQPAADQPRRRR